MNRSFLLMLLSVIMASPISAMQQQQTNGQVALSYGATGAKAIGSGLWAATAKTFGWTCGMGQLALGGAAVGASALLIYSLVGTHKKSPYRLSDEDTRKVLLFTGCTAITFPIGCMLMFKGAKNVWNA